MTDSNLTPTIEASVNRALRDKLAPDGYITCPRCRTLTVRERHGVLRCAKCNRTYPHLGTIPAKKGGAGKQRERDPYRTFARKNRWNP